MAVACSLHKQVTAYWKRNKLFSTTFVTILCSLFYFLGVWQPGVVLHVPTTRSYKEKCFTTTQSSPLSSSSSRSPDFSAYHMAEEMINTSTVDFPPCDLKYSEYIPCEEASRSLKYSRERLVYRERHCPRQEELLKCRVPAPYGYKTPFTWPTSRDYAWYDNVPHKHLTVEKAGQNWILYEGDRFTFPGGGTTFRNGADAYIDEIGKLINLTDGFIRTAIDTGCGVASWGAYLLSRNILAMSFAPVDTHEAQVQFALERGVPAMIAVIGTKRLPYPSRAFDMAHCSRCLIPWAEYDGQYLIEVDRILRPGGFWILSGPPVNWEMYWKGWNRTRDDLEAEHEKIESTAKSLCWKKHTEKGGIAIWQKPTNHNNCNPNRKITKNVPFCQGQDPDIAWYTNLETCITPLPPGGELTKWPERLTVIPPRILSKSIEEVTQQKFHQDMKVWEKRVAYYKSVNNELGQKGRYRNVLDMNAHLGGFAAALYKDPLWVMNVVPVESMVNTLGIIYERGLIGTYQSWCEAMSTYPRTYDLLHADLVFTLYDGRCDIEDILLEMDRILRPEGAVIIRDDVDNLLKIKSITDGLKWETRIVDHEDSPHYREKLLFSKKLYWTAPDPPTVVQ